MKSYIIFVAIAIAFVHVFGAATISTKSSETFTTEIPPKKESCVGRTPCGWAIYNRTNRYIDYFMKNRRCQCGNDRKCLRDENDISIAAYVYRCKTDEEIAALFPDES